MSVFLKTAGAALIALGVLIVVVILSKPGVLDALGIRLDTAALLLIGGVLANGQAAIVAALKQRGGPVMENKVMSVAAKPTDGVLAAQAEAAHAFTRKIEEPAKGFGKGATAATAGVAAVAGAGLAAVAAKASTKDPVAETISALEQAKADVIKSIGGMDAAAPSPAAALQQETAKHDPFNQHAAVTVPEPAALDEETADEAVEGEEDLYVVEEKVVRGRPARILSDDTVEAETDEGWMRFENMEHLNEYLDSVEEQSA